MTNEELVATATEMLMKDFVKARRELLAKLEAGDRAAEEKQLDIDYGLLKIDRDYQKTMLNSAELLIEQYEKRMKEQDRAVALVEKIREIFTSNKTEQEKFDSTFLALLQYYPDKPDGEDGE